MNFLSEGEYVPVEEQVPEEPAKTILDEPDEPLTMFDEMLDEPEEPAFIEDPVPRQVGILMQGGVDIMKLIGGTNPGTGFGNSPAFVKVGLE